MICLLDHLCTSWHIKPYPNMHITSGL